MRVWRVADQRPAFPPLAGHTGPITGTAFDPSGSFLATTTPFGATRLWDPATGLGYGDELVASPRPDSAASSIEFPQFLGLRNAFSPDGKLLAVAGVGTLCDVVGRRPRRLAPARVRDRGPEPDARGVEALPAGGDAVSRRRVREWPSRLTLAERSEIVPLAQRTSAGAGDRAGRSRERRLTP